MSQWPMMPLGEICDTTSGGTPSRSHPEYFGGSIPWIKSGDLTDGDVVACDENITEEALRNSSAKLFRKGTVLIAMYGATVGKLGMLGIDAATNQAVCGISTPDELDRRFLFYFLLSQRQILIEQSAGGAQPNISQKIVRELLVPVPLLPEQRRIVDLLTRAEGIVRLRCEADKKAAELIPALFLDMFRLSNSANWKEYFFGDSAVMEIIDGDRGTNYPKKSDFGKSGYCLFLNTSNVRKGVFDFSKCDFVTQEKDGTLRKGKLIRGDVILTTRGTIGNSAHYHNEVPYENVRINSGMVVLRANPTLLDSADVRFDGHLATLKAAGVSKQVMEKEHGKKSK